MKHLCACIFGLGLLAAAFTIESCSKQSRKEMWWTYLADYDGTPGSIVVNLALKDRAPIAGFGYCIVTGVSYESSGTRGLPRGDELRKVQAIEDQIVDLLGRSRPAVFAGAFTHADERWVYVYVQTTNGIENDLKQFYQTSHPDRKPYIHVKPDANWECYREFLFPNQKTIEFYKADLQKIGFLKR